MFRKYLDNLLFEEVVTLIENNSDIAESIREEGVEYGGRCLDEYLCNCKGCDWSISYGYEYGDYFNITERSKFEKWYEETQQDYGLLSDEENEVVQQYIYYSDLFDHVSYLWDYGRAKDKDYNFLQDKSERLEAEVEKMIFKRLRSEIDYWLDAEPKQLAEIFDLWSDNHGGEELYTDNRMTNVYEYFPKVIVPEHETLVM